jgi:hypothetical protein
MLMKKHHNNQSLDMKPKSSVCIILILILTSLCVPLVLAFGQKKGITEQECTTYEGAAILWDLRIYRWVCCIPKGEDLEDCIVIIDKKPLPKTSIKPLPPPGSRTIIQPKQNPDAN